MAKNPPPPVSFVYLADTCFGAESTLDLLPCLLDSLAAWLRDHPAAAFVLHGGNLVDRPEPALIRQAAALFRLPVPTFLCVGPLDRPDTQAEILWLREAPALFPGGRVDFTLETPAFDLHALPPDNRNLHQLLAETGGRPRLVCTHQTVLGRPAPPPHAGTLADRLLAIPSVRAVLASANGLASEVRRQDVLFLAAASLVARPFPFLEVTAGARGVSFVTHTLETAVPSPPLPPMDTTYLTGRP